MRSLLAFPNILLIPAFLWTAVWVTRSDAAWTYKRPIIVTNDTGGTLADFQVSVDLTTVIMGNPYNNVNADGSDIRFSTGDYTEPLPYWMQSWNTTGDSKFWVKVSSIPPGTDTLFYMYYGNASATSESDGDSTFEQYNVSGIVGFWHTDESSWNGTPDEVQDETGTNHGVAAGDANTVASGKFNRGGNFDGTGDYVDCGNDVSLDVEDGNFSLEAWVKPDSVTGYDNVISKSKSSSPIAGWILRLDDGRYSWLANGYGSDTYRRNLVSSGRLAKWINDKCLC